jgi:DNA-binding transcriptional ArsR family regulator
VSAARARARSRTAAAVTTDAAPVFTALGDETRLYLVSRLCEEGPLSISSLAEGTRMSRQAVTKHLRVLAGTGLARCGRSGREQVWQIEAARLADVRRLLGKISAQWEQSLERLQTFLESRKS